MEKRHFVTDFCKAYRRSTPFQDAEELGYKRFVSGHDFGRAEKPLYFSVEPALAGGTEGLRVEHAFRRACSMIKETRFSA